MVRSLKNDIPYVVICGPTASGKSALAMDIASEWDGEIVSFDSVQFYKGFNIGSAKPSTAEQTQIPHHMIDILNWTQDYDASLYARDARLKVKDIQNRGRLPILVGGSGLFLRAFWGQDWHENLPKDEGLRLQLQSENSESLYATLVVCDPKRAAQLHKNDKFRIVRALELFHLTGKTFGDLTSQSTDKGQQRGLVVKVVPERKELHKNIAVRSAAMIHQGLIEETLLLLNQGCPVDCRPMQSIGYRQVAEFLTQRFPLADLSEKIAAATRQYAKRQLTWFQKVAADLEYEEEMTHAFSAVEGYIKSQSQSKNAIHALHI